MCINMFIYTQTDACGEQRRKRERYTNIPTHLRVSSRVHIVNVKKYGVVYFLFSFFPSFLKCDFCVMMLATII